MSYTRQLGQKGLCRLLGEGKLQHKGGDAPPQETHHLVQQGGLGQGFHTHCQGVQKCSQEYPLGSHGGATRPDQEQNPILVRLECYHVEVYSKAYSSSKKDLLCSTFAGSHTDYKKECRKDTGEGGVIRLVGAFPQRTRTSRLLSFFLRYYFQK